MINRPLFSKLVPKSNRVQAERHLGLIEKKGVCADAFFAIMGVRFAQKHYFSVH